MLNACAQQNRGKYFYKKVAIVSEDANVRAQAKEYFESYVFGID